MASPKIYIRNYGFTFLEILLTLALFVIVASLSLAASLDVYKSFNYADSQSLLLTLLRRARSDAVNNIDGLPHGIFIQNHTYILFEGRNYQARNQTRDLTFPTSSNIDMSGNTEVVFAPLSATTSSGQIILEDHIHKQTIITIGDEGQINLH